MRWDIGELCRFAADAGFAHDMVPTAAALAVATSGGVDHYDFAPGSPGVGRYVGLWGVDTDRFDQYAGRTLFDPTVNAAVAKELTDTFDGFGWSPTFLVGAHVSHVDRAGVARTRPLAGQAPARDVGAATTNAVVRQSIARVHDLRRTLSLVRTVKGF